MESSPNNDIEEVVEIVYEPTSMWKRLGAALLDLVVCIILSIVVCIIIFLIYIFISRFISSGTEISEKSFEGFIVIVLLVVEFLYFSIMESSKSQGTFGKIAMNIIVTDYEGERIGYLRSSVRTLTKYVSSSCFYIGYLMGFLTKKHQMFHDFAAKTYVLDREPVKEIIEEGSTTRPEDLY